ncbi:MAG: tRNA 2-selenouridine(34) synthase MnmH [Bacteroidia bacterium]|nr:tRNA 2-selenouridine(34) synthase MnmH [Bacteroidia bacterium]
MEIENFLRLSDSLPVIDVRSPCEYGKGHIPGAYNIPLFSDAERSQIGTIYRQTGTTEAMMEGLKIAGIKLSDYISQITGIAGNREAIIYCWRGGMRSQSMAWLFNQSGIRAMTLSGGYKAYRQYIRQSFNKKARLIVLGGLTGSGKTEILKEIRKQGHQIIDLESLAHHKGSVFGALGQPPQPANEQFENNLFDHWRKLDFTKPVWIEDESRMLGSIQIPDALFSQIPTNQLVVEAIVDKKERIERLVKEYSVFDSSLLTEAIMKIRKRIGGQNVKLCLEALKKKDYHTFADYTLRYYDKLYKGSLQRRNPQTIYSFENNYISIIESTKKILTFGEKLFFCLYYS